MEVPRLGATSELQLPAYTTATAMPDLTCVCTLHHSSQQQWILNPLSEVRDTGWGCYSSSWILVGVVTAEPRWELLFKFSMKFRILLLVSVAEESNTVFC